MMILADHVTAWPLDASPSGIANSVAHTPTQLRISILDHSVRCYFALRIVPQHVITRHSNFASPSACALIFLLCHWLRMIWLVWLRILPHSCAFHKAICSFFSAVHFFWIASGLSNLEQRAIPILGHVLWGIHQYPEITLTFQSLLRFCQFYCHGSRFPKLCIHIATRMLH